MHFDGQTLTSLYRLGLGSGARDLVFQMLALDNLNGETELCEPRRAWKLLVPAHRSTGCAAT
jgi:hypothetical protein